MSSTGTSSPQAVGQAGGLALLDLGGQELGVLFRFNLSREPVVHRR